MLYDLMSYPMWVVAALAIGLVIGWQTYSDAPQRYWRDGWILWGAVAFVLGTILAALKLLPGRYGLWLEVALLISAFYIVGCFVGGWLKNIVIVREPAGR